MAFRNLHGDVLGIACAICERWEGSGVSDHGILSTVVYFQERDCLGRFVNVNISRIFIISSNIINGHNGSRIE